MVKKMELTVEVTRAFEFDTIFDISAQGAVKFGYPGLKPSVDNVVHFSERIRPKRTISSINVSHAVHMFRAQPWSCKAQPLTRAQIQRLVPFSLTSHLGSVGASAPISRVASSCEQSHSLCRE